MNSERSSFTAADSMPVKLLKNYELVSSIVENKIIPPLHVQVIPTNKCNLDCSFCSCSKDDREGEMDISQLEKVTDSMIKHDAAGVTITGGGEPLIYEHLDHLIWKLNRHGIRVGLVTNGLLLPRQNYKSLDSLEWCRISQGDDREIWTKGFLDRLSDSISNMPSVDWAFSYVVSKNPDVEKIKTFIKFADDHGFTHVRLVADLLCTDKIPMESLKSSLGLFLKDINVPVIFQDRKKPEKGENCRVCYLRPVIAPDMKIYACCGAQYAMKKPTLNFPPELCLGDVKDFESIIENSSEPFEGAKHCEYCYYGNYNRALDMLITDTVHNEFI